LSEERLPAARRRSAARKAISREGETGFRSPGSLRCSFPAQPGSSLIFGPYEIDAVAPFQPADREMGLGDILKMVHEDRVDKGPADRADGRDAGGGGFFRDDDPEARAIAEMKRTRTGAPLAVSPRLEMN